MKNHNASQSSSRREWHEPYFTPAPPRYWDAPAAGTIEISDRYPPRVKFAGTLWRFQVCGPTPKSLKHRQSVTIVGRQGNCLLIEI